MTSRVLHTQAVAPHPVLDVGLPPDGHVPQVKEFDVPVVVAGAHAAVLVVVGVAC